MPAALARVAMASGLPPSELLTCQIHIPAPSKGLPAGLPAAPGAFACLRARCWWRST